MVYIKNHYPSLYADIVSTTDFLPNDTSFAERLYCIKNDITAVKMCPVCNMHALKFSTSSGKYRTTCSRDCSRKNPIRIEKAKITWENNNSVQQMIENSRKTRIKKFGQWCPKDFSARVKHTKKEKYGNENYINLNKIIQTNITRYGCQYAAQTNETKDKLKKTCLEKYGVPNFGMTESAIQSRSNGIRKRSWIYIENYPEIEPVFTESDYIHGHTADEFAFKCTHCGTTFKSRWDNGGLVTPCPTCHPINHGQSKLETEVIDFIKSISDAEIIIKDRKHISPKEIDILIPSKKCGIEFDGVFYHSNYYKQDPKYHLEKTIACEQIGYNLIHIFEDEWVFKKDIVKDRIKHLLGTTQNRIFARKCKIVNLKYSDAEIFLNLNHIQGAVKTSINIGLTYNGSLVSVMTFSKPRFSKKYQYELIRFCSRLNCSVIGAASKLFQYFIKTYDPTTVISYADRRYSTGKLYDVLNFKRISSSNPNYFYIKPSNIRRLSRLQFQKHKLKNVLQNYDEKLSEEKNMRNNGYYRIYDCGNLVYLWQK